MRKHLLLSVVGLIMAASLHAQTGTPIKDSIMHDIYRTFIVYVPASYNPTTAVPLLLNLHGNTQNAEYQNSLADFKPVADTANFIIVLPNGGPVPEIGGSQGWNNYPGSSGVDDVGFLSDLIDTLCSRYNIDANRIYSTGHSAGAVMSYRLACRLSSRITAIASVNGTMFPSEMAACSPQHPTPVMEIHGTSDPIRDWDGTGPIVKAVNIDTLINYWVKSNNCSKNPDYDSVPDINKTDNCWVQHYRYSGGSSGSTVELYKIIYGGHTWPGSAESGPFGNTNMDFSACKEIWRFLSAYRHDLLTGIYDNAWESPSLVVYPNPVANELNISWNNFRSPRQIAIYDMMGKEVLIMAMSMPTNRLNINTSSWSPGVYLLKQVVENKVYYSKIVKK